MRRIIGVLIAVALVLAALLALRLYLQERQLHGPSGGSGEIEGIELRLATKISSRVLTLNTTEGAAVKQGDLLLTLDCAEPEAALAEADARLAAANAQAQSALAGAGAAEVAYNAARSSITASRAQAQALGAQRDAARRQVERLDVIGGYVAESSRDQAQANAEGLAHQVDAANASSQASDAQAKASSQQARAARSQAEAAQATVAVAESGIARARLLVAECEVRAPRDALVESLPFEAGELVTPGAPVARLVDLRSVKATFYLPNAELGAARPGAEALVEADAYPGKVFKGTVLTVAARAEFTPRNIQTRSDRDRLVYPVEVLVPNPGLELRQGMPVQVTLPGTERAR